MQRRDLKVAIVAEGYKHHELAVKANRHLPSELHLTESAITRIVTCRKDPTPKQASALAKALNRSVSEIFEEVAA